MGYQHRANNNSGDDFMWFGVCKTVMCATIEEFYDGSVQDASDAMLAGETVIIPPVERGFFGMAYRRDPDDFCGNCSQIAHDDDIICSHCGAALVQI